MTEGHLDGRISVVTGGARGIGLAIAQRFVASGARVQLWDLDSGALELAITALGRHRVSARTVDVTDYGQVETARDALIAAEGGLDVLVNNAGISGPTMPLTDTALTDWGRILEVNLTAVFHCCRALVPVMAARGYGRIVNLASLAGKEGTPNASAYSASKAGVIALTKSLGKELAESGVLVNCIAPAAVETRILAQMTEEHVATMLSKSPMKRFGGAEEVAAMAAWLASAECSFSTGACFDLSGGRATY